MTRKMKDSGIEWIGDIPEDWEMVKNKYSFRNKKKIVGEEFKDYNLLSLTKSKGIIYRDIENMEGKLPESFGTYQSVKKDDLVLCLFDIDISSVFSDVSRFDGMISSAYNTFEIKDNYPMFYKYWFDMVNDGRKYRIYSKSLRYTIDLDNFNSLYSPMPPIDQQKAIADFLDEKTQEIDNIISKTKKAIEEYKKYKQSLITETVTKGLNENVRMKDSGIEWIGEIPEHWDVIRFKDLFKFGSGLTITKSNLIDEGIKVINYGEIHSKYKFDLDINRDELKCVDKSYLENRRVALINKGDFVFCDTSEDREGSGNCIVLRESNDELVFAGSHTVTARLKRSENPIYIRYMIMASSIKEQISSRVVGIKVYSITQGILKQIIGVVPPIKEQEQIASYLDKKTAQIDQIISTKEKLLIEMEAYKKSLIYEVVTGKREVE